MKKNLVLLPGLLCDHALWQHQIKAFENDFNITVANMTGVSTMQEMAKSVLNQSPETFALAGLSMGGYCALEIMQQSPERVEKLALLDTTARADTKEQTEFRKSLITLCEDEGLNAVTDVLLPKFIHPQLLVNKQLTQAIRDMTNRIGAESFKNQQMAIISREDMREKLKSISKPVILICGRQDELTPLTHHQEMHEQISGSKLSIIEDCGHLSTMEQPDNVTATLKAWLTL